MDYFNTHPLLVAIAFSASVNLLRLVDPSVRVFEDDLTFAALLNTFNILSFVKRVHEDKSKLTFNPVKPPKVVSDEQSENIPVVPSTLLVSNSGIVVRLEQPENIPVILVTLLVSNCGIVVRLEQ